MSSLKKHGKNGLEVGVDNNSIFWLHEKHTEEGLDHTNLSVLTSTYHSDYRKHRYELVDEPKDQPNRIFLHENLAIKIIMHCRRTG